MCSREGVRISISRAAASRGAPPVSPNASDRETMQTVEAASVATTSLQDESRRSGGLAGPFP
jgi:hypothetical protein